MSLKGNLQDALRRVTETIETSFDETGTTTEMADQKTARLLAAFQSFGGHFSEYVADINRTRNATTALYRLPDEVLVSIIGYALEDCPNLEVQGPGDFGSEQYEALFGFGTVSRRWYSVVIGTPSFWTTVPICGHPSLISDIVSRSRALPLRLEGCIYSQYEQTARTAIRFRMQSVADIFKDHLHRWQDLDLLISEINIDPLLELLQGTAASMRSVSLTVDEQVEDMQPLNLFGGQADHLEHVTLNQTVVDWSSPVFSGLRTLSLTELPRGPFLGELLEILRRSPALESLTLVGVTFGEERLAKAAEWVECDAISMRQLRELKLIHLGFDTVQCIVRHLRNLDNCQTMKLNFSTSKTIDLSYLQTTFIHLKSLMTNIFTPPKRLVLESMEDITISQLSGGSSFLFRGGPGTNASVIAWLPSVLNPARLQVPVYLRVVSGQDCSTLLPLRLFNVVMLEVKHVAAHFIEPPSQHEIAHGYGALLQVLGGAQMEGWGSEMVFPRLRKFRVDMPSTREVVEMLSKRCSGRYEAEYEREGNMPSLKISLQRHTPMQEVEKVAAIVGRDNVLLQGVRRSTPVEEGGSVDPKDIYKIDPATEFHSWITEFSDSEEE